MNHKFAIMHRVERAHKDVVMSTIDCILEPLSHYIDMEANVEEDLSVEDDGAHVYITMTFDIRGAK